MRNIGDYDSGGDYYNILVPIVKLRWNFIELTYRGIFGINGVWINNLIFVEDTDYSGKTLNWGNQIMIGLYYETSKRSK
jgi:hypothetical protein